MLETMGLKPTATLKRTTLVLDMVTTMAIPCTKKDMGIMTASTFLPTTMVDKQINDL